MVSVRGRAPAEDWTNHEPVTPAGGTQNLARLHRAQRPMQAVGGGLQGDGVAQHCRPEGALALGSNSPACSLTLEGVLEVPGEAGGGGVVPPLDAPHVSPGLQLDDSQVSRLAPAGVVGGVDDHVLDLKYQVLELLSLTMSSDKLCRWWVV